MWCPWIKSNSVSSSGSLKKIRLFCDANEWVEDSQIPQETVLGPLLFITYIIDIFGFNKNAQIVGLTDDMGISYKT